MITKLRLKLKRNTTRSGEREIQLEPTKEPANAGNSRIHIEEQVQSATGDLGPRKI